MPSPRRLDLVCKHLILLDRKESSPAFRELAKTQTASCPNADARFQANSTAARTGSRGRPDCEYFVSTSRQSRPRSLTEPTLPHQSPTTSQARASLRDPKSGSSRLENATSSWRNSWEKAAAPIHADLLM